MSAAKVLIYCGTGTGRTAAAVGLGLRHACNGDTVFMVRFLKGKASTEYEFLKRLEPEIKSFCFDKFDAPYGLLNEEEKEEERIHTKNGLSYARKVAATSECDVLILDEVLDLVDYNIISAEDLIGLVEAADDCVSIILTGKNRCEALWPYADLVTEVTTLKKKE